MKKNNQKNIKKIKKNKLKILTAVMEGGRKVIKDQEERGGMPVQMFSFLS